MKSLIFSMCFLAFAVTANAQVSTVTTFNGKTFAKATSRTDTSQIVTVGGYPVISIATTTTGTDSAKMQIEVDGLVNGLWLNDVLPAKGLTLGRPADTTLAGSAHTGQVLSWFLRDQGRAIDNLQNCSQLRIRNTLSSGAGDSTSATTYTQKVVLRKW